MKSTFQHSADRVNHPFELRMRFHPGGSSSRKAVKEFRKKVIKLFREQLPQHIRPPIPSIINHVSSDVEASYSEARDLFLSVPRMSLPVIPTAIPSESCILNSTLCHSIVEMTPLSMLHGNDTANTSATHAQNLTANTVPEESAERLKNSNAKLSAAPDAGVPVIENVCHHLAQRVAELVSAETSRPKTVLVGRGKYNPMHKMHLRHFVIARQYLEERTRFSVLGGLLVPKHATEVRQRCRTRPREIIPTLSSVLFQTFSRLYGGAGCTL